MEGMQKIEFEVEISGKGWLYVPIGEDPKKYVEKCQAQLGGNKLFHAKVKAKNVEVKEDR